MHRSPNAPLSLPVRDEKHCGERARRQASPASAEAAVAGRGILSGQSRSTGVAAPQILSANGEPLFEAVPLSLEGLLELRPVRYGDDRGFLSETFSQNALAVVGIEARFVSEQHSYSGRRGIVRGLHYQLPPRSQARLVRVIRGRILDVVVDIRSTSPSFGKWCGIELSAARWNQLFVPEGYAHGYLTLDEDTEVLCKVTAPGEPGLERTIRFDDPAIAIDWQYDKDGLFASNADRAAPCLADAELYAEIQTIS